MRIGKLFLICFFLPLSTFSQSKVAISKNGGTQLSWSNPIRITMLGGANDKTMYFEGADYNYTDHFLPRYLKRVELNGNENNFSASLINTVFEPLTTEESAAVPAKAVIPAEITLNTSVCVQRKHPYGIVSFIPIRKNSFTGKYEKLVSFDIQFKPMVSSVRSGMRSHTYASNSVLQSGKWYKIATTSNGLYKLSYTFLQSLGINMSSVDPHNLRVYGNGGGMLPELNSAPRIDDLAELAIYMQDNGDTDFDNNEYAEQASGFRRRLQQQPSQLIQLRHLTTMHLQKMITSAL
jgi:hypothetical protein